MSTRWLVGIAAAAALSLAGWNMTATVGHNARLSIQEERSDHLIEGLKRIEVKLDRLIEKR